MKVLMVCLGNICRSPLAEGIFRDKVSRRKLKILVDSAGTIDLHEGEKPDSRSINIALKNDVDISFIESRKFSITDFTDFDYIFVMDNKNYYDIFNLTSNDNEKNKIFFLTEFLFPKKQFNVPDPYYGTEKDFEIAYKLIEDSCEKIIEKLFS